MTNLVELNVNVNKKITDINHLINLRILYAKCDCRIDNNGISSLTNLVELYICYNKKITNTNHLINLRILDARYGCRIDNNNILSLTNLVKLGINNKKLKIKSINISISYFTFHYS